VASRQSARRPAGIPAYLTVAEAADFRARQRRRRKRRPVYRRLRYRRLFVLALVIALLPLVYSYATTMAQPSSLPLGVRSIEWVRAQGGAWLVNDIENVYYSWTAPAKGGPQLKRLPVVGLGYHRQPAGRQRSTSRDWPPRVRSAISPALPGEGVWRSTGRLVRGAPPVLITTFRPEAAYPRIVAYAAWIDSTRTQLALYPGRYEPPASLPRGPMEVPVGQRWRLLATFNSGFTYRDGHGGFAVDGRSYTPLRDGMGTLVATRGGGVNILSWRWGPTPGPRIVLARQNLPLILNGGRPNPSLSDSSAWGATLGNAVRVWRSGIGIDRRGNLIYAAADYQTVGTLAALLRRAGAVRAIELDINAEWPSFITYGRAGWRDPAKLVPNVQQPSTRYLSPDDRDFFAVYRRAGSSLVPFR
jgi:hypothetical protein